MITQRVATYQFPNNKATARAPFLLLQTKRWAPVLFVDFVVNRATGGEISPR